MTGVSSLFLLGMVFGAFDAQFPSASSAARGGAGVAQVGEFGASEANPACAAGTISSAAGVEWTRPLGLDGLDLTGVWVRAPLPLDGGAALRWRSLLAGDVYREDQIAADAAIRIHGVSAGSGIRWGRVEVSGRDLGHPVGWSAGMACEALRGVELGFAWEDASGIDPAGIRTPWAFRVGGGWRGRDSSWSADMGAERDEGLGWSWRAGQEWRWDPIRLRLGFRTDPLVLCLGIGAAWRSVVLDWGAQTESKFGWQNHAGIAWRF